MLTTFCGDYLSMLYFYGICFIMTSQWVPILLGMPHCGITMGNYNVSTLGNVIARYIKCDVTMGNNIVICSYHCITMGNDVAANLFCYVLLRQLMILMFHQ